MLQTWETSCSNTFGSKSRIPSSGISGGLGQRGPESGIQTKQEWKPPTPNTSWPLLLILRNIEEASHSIGGSSVLTSIHLFFLCRVLFKLKPSLADISHRVSKRNRLGIPVSDPEVSRSRGSWRLEALHPVAIARKLVARLPAFVPQTGHCVFRKVLSIHLELSGRTTFVSGVEEIINLKRSLGKEWFT